MQLELEAVSDRLRAGAQGIELRMMLAMVEQMPPGLELAPAQDPALCVRLGQGRGAVLVAST